MAMSPFYIPPGNDLSQGLTGLSATLSDIRQSRIVEAERERQRQQEEAQALRMQEASMAAQEAFKSGDPALMAQASLQYPEIGESLRQSYGLNEEFKAKEASDFARRLLLANPDQRSQIYEERINTLTEQGRDPRHTAQSYKDYLNNPNGELKALETVWAATDPKGYGVIAEQQRAEQKAQLEAQREAARNARFQASEAAKDRRAAMRGGEMGQAPAAVREFEYYQQLKQENPEEAEAYGRAKGYISKEGKELSSHLQKRLSVATDDAIKAEGEVSKLRNLADEIDASDIGGGLLGSTWKEAAKEITGSQDADSELRRQFNAIKASQVVNNLPPGAASDTDIALALSGFPSDKANKQQITGFLRGLSKLQEQNARFNNFKADYIAQKGHERGMLKAWKEGGAADEQAPAAAPASSGGWEIVE